MLTRTELLALAAICDARGHKRLADRCQAEYEATEPPSSGGSTVEED